MRFLQRSAIFGLGIFSVWLIVFVVFETADRRLPGFWLWASLMDLPRMFFLPRAIRLGLKILRRKRVPSYTITGDGLPGEPCQRRTRGYATAASIGLHQSSVVGSRSTGTGKLLGHDRASYSNRLTPPHHLAPSIFSDVPGHRFSKRQLITARGNAITYDFGLWRRNARSATLGRGGLLAKPLTGRRTMERVSVGRSRHERIPAYP